jgi:endogenous inhibitor of DNA gyrase (YacG/DUF329 family)
VIPAARGRSTACPRCGAAIAWPGNPQRPFCSFTCRLLDLGNWLDERYRIAGPEIPVDAVDDDRLGSG